MRQADTTMPRQDVSVAAERQVYDGRHETRKSHSFTPASGQGDCRRGLIATSEMLSREMLKAVGIDATLVTRVNTASSRMQSHDGDIKCSRKMAQYFAKGDAIARKCSGLPGRLPKRASA